MLALVGAVVLWGASFAATKAAIEAFQPMTVVWLRISQCGLMVGASKVSSTVTGLLRRTCT